jgi:hypothetical protein
MRPTSFIVITLFGLLPFAAVAQFVTSTNAPATKIENFEMQTNVIMVKGYGEIGTVTTGKVLLRCWARNRITSRREINYTA